MDYGAGIHCKNGTVIERVIDVDSSSKTLSGLRGIYTCDIQRSRSRGDSNVEN